jgi:hypothetical protein
VGDIVYDMTKVSIDAKGKQMGYTKDFTMKPSKDKVESILKDIVPTFASEALNYLDETMLFKGTVTRFATTEDGNFGLEIGHIPEDLSKGIPEPTMVWFEKPEGGVQESDLKSLEGTDILFVARYYLRKKDGTLSARGSHIFA